MKLTPSEIDDLIHREAPEFTPAAVRGMRNNAMIESGGESTAEGDYVRGRPTSFNLFQHHNKRADQLAAFAKSISKSPDDPVAAVKFAVQEVRTKFPGLNALMQSTNDDQIATRSFRKIFENPKDSSVPSTGAGKFRFSAFALGEHDGRRNTDVVFMTPQDYLDLSPPMEGDRHAERGGRQLRDSMRRGEEVEAIPTLDVDVKDNVGTVTAQDGRNRAKLAQEEGLQQIPVAVKRNDAEMPGELKGMSGVIVPTERFTKKDEPLPSESDEWAAFRMSPEEAQQFQANAVAAVPNAPEQAPPPPRRQQPVPQQTFPIANAMKNPLSQQVAMLIGSRAQERTSRNGLLDMFMPS